MDKIYDRVKDVIGGSDDNQLFTMMLPGTLLNQDDFLKGASTDIDLRTSNLVNTLLDVCEVAAAHNGQSLSDQYRSALDHLLPKIDADLERLRSKLRDALKQTSD